MAKTIALLKPAAAEPVPGSDALHSGTLVVGAGGKVSASNLRARALFGYGESEFPNLGFSELVEPGEDATDRSWFERLSTGLTESAREKSYPVRGLRKDGTTFDSIAMITPVAFGQRSGFITTFTEPVGDSTSRLRWFDRAQRWRSLLEQLGDTLWFWDFTDDWVEFTRSWVDSMGYSPGELSSGTAWFEILHPEDRERVQAQVRTCLEGTLDRFECEFRLRRKSGAYRWILSSGRVVDWSDDPGAPLMVGIYRDTTAQHEAVDELVQTETRWEQALRGSELGVWDWDLLTDKVFFSPEWKRMIGYEPGDLEPTIETWRSLALPEDLAASDAAIADHLAGKTEEYRAECRIRTRDGGIKWILDRGKIVTRGADGTPRRMIGTHDDITEMKLREREIRESRERQERIAGLIPGVVYQFELSPDGSARFPYASDGIRDVYGVTPEEAAKDAAIVFTRLHPDDRDEVMRTIQASADDLARWDHQYRVVDADGNERWLHGVANPQRAPENDGTVLWHGYISDITERKHMSLALQQRTRAVQLANEDLEQFNYIAAHDLKEPLRSIQHLTEWIIDDLPADVPESVAHNIDRLQARAQRLGGLVEGLADYSRAGQQNADLVAVDPIRMAEDLSFEVDLSEFVYNVSGTVGEPFASSAVALETVLRNLVANAAVHHDRRGTGCITVAFESGPDDITVAVEDDGPGIEGKHHERIFRMYQRLDPESGKPGSGSGLAIVKRILNTVGSSIEIESPITDRGTRFRFKWPRNWPQE